MVFEPFRDRSDCSTSGVSARQPSLTHSKLRGTHESSTERGVRVHRLVFLKVLSFEIEINRFNTHLQVVLMLFVGVYMFIRKRTVKNTNKLRNLRRQETVYTKAHDKIHLVRPAGKRAYVQQQQQQQRRQQPSEKSNKNEARKGSYTNSRT